MNQKDFEIKYKYPLLWFNQADRHLYSASIIYKEIENLLSNNNYTNDFEERNIFEQKYRALSGTYLFLMGIAFENLIKGWIISKEPPTMDISAVKLKYKWNDRHNIYSMITENITSLDEDEKDSIKRIEGYLIWIGKYPLPKNANQKNANDYNLKKEDKKVLEKLFWKIWDKININWGINEIKYFQWIQS